MGVFGKGSRLAGWPAGVQHGRWCNTAPAAVPDLRPYWWLRAILRPWLERHSAGALPCLQPGNGAAFLSLVEKLTGEALAANAWVKELQTPTKQKVCGWMCGVVVGRGQSSRLPTHPGTPPPATSPPSPIMPTFSPELPLPFLTPLSRPHLLAADRGGAQGVQGGGGGGAQVPARERGGPRHARRAGGLTAFEYCAVHCCGRDAVMCSTMHCPQAGVPACTRIFFACLPIICRCTAMK